MSDGDISSRDEAMSLAGIAPDPLTQAEAALAKMRETKESYLYGSLPRFSNEQVGSIVRDAALAFEAIVAELRERREAERWRPIAEAPRDGTEVLTWNGKDVQAGTWQDDRDENNSNADFGWCYGDPRWGGTLYDGLNVMSPQPTHFRPLPQPPETDDE